MHRTVLAVPLDEIRKHLASNDRQDVKVVAPQRLSEALYERLMSKGKLAKREASLEGHIWRHSTRFKPNYLCESNEFLTPDMASAAHRSFALSFANEKAQQDEHYHREHLEIYFSEHAISSVYHCIDEEERHTITLEHGGAVVFGPGVVHRMKLGGLTLVIEVPSVKDDKVNAPVTSKNRS